MKRSVRYPVLRRAVENYGYPLAGGGNEASNLVEEPHSAGRSSDFPPAGVADHVVPIHDVRHMGDDSG